VRGDPGQAVEKAGFIAHPSMTGRDLPRTFVRGHIHGQFQVAVRTVGTMPETYVIPGTEIVGGWLARDMNGNTCYNGHVVLPGDRKKFRIQAMTAKDGSISKLSVYVHPRYIYYQRNAETAAWEFRQQVKDILAVLERHGWSFGEILQRGTYSMGINDPILASHVPTDHNEATTDDVLYDSSPGRTEGGCTEAEILRIEPTDEEQVALMVDLPSRFLGLERTVNGIMTILERSLPAQEALTQRVADLTRATEFNTSVIFGDRSPVAQPYHRTDADPGDVMYG
jgi:hypothetical protein